MGTRAQRSPETRSVGFRMPLDLYNELAAVAEMRGVDMSGMLNWILSEYRPMLQKKKADYEAAMLEAAAKDLGENLTANGGTEKALTVLRNLLRQLQDLYAAVSKRALDEDERRAG